jgi:hypothetical protein
LHFLFSFFFPFFSFLLLSLPPLHFSLGGPLLLRIYSVLTSSFPPGQDAPSFGGHFQERFVQRPKRPQLAVSPRRRQKAAAKLCRAAQKWLRSVWVVGVQIERRPRLNVCGCGRR